MSQHVKYINCVFHSGLIVLVLLGLTTSEVRAEEPSGHGIPYHTVADYIHDIIEADRTLYTTHVVDRMQETGTAIASESWVDRNALPLPAQMLLLSGERVKNRGGGLNYRLASLWPIYKKNGPANDFERKGLQAVQENPDEPFTGLITQGNESRFEAIYADLAVSKSCVNCHNRHLLSPKRDHKLGDVMGAIIISFPVKP
ncbi:MAG: DUF3365 domain-containing protein [Nitrospirota bacterium]|nr:DUF3365 domain-containing protein [Nitrospirota bacterium]MDH5588143.1 DUF3365 domain-containing protein [Nitrospirota bacterium]